MKAARVLLYCAAAYGLVGAAVLWIVVHRWSSDGPEGGDIVTHGLVVPAVWFAAGAVLLLCAANVADSPRTIGRLSIAVACVGYLLVLVFGPLRVSVDMYAQPQVAAIGGISTALSALLWAVFAAAAISGGVLALRGVASTDTRLTSASWCHSSSRGIPEQPQVASAPTAE